MTELSVTLIPCLSDNYTYVFTSGDAVAVVDPGEAAPVRKVLEEKGLTLTHILNTHWHPDHIGGNDELKEAYGAPVIGPEAERHAIAGLDQGVREGEEITIGHHTARVIETPAHTAGHIAFFFPEGKVVFTGDTLFALGCGRLFEGDAPTMWASLSKLRALPDDTRVYCGHEYTLSNAKFSLTIDPDNPALAERAEEIEALRAENKPTIPTTIGLEKRTNPFIRAEDPGIRRTLGMEDAEDVAVFAEIRQRKDNA